MTPNSIASYAGLKDGDYIIRVNGEYVEHLSHSKLVQKFITGDKNLVDLVVASDFKSYLISDNQESCLNSFEDTTNEKRILELKKQASVKLNSNRKFHLSTI